MSADPPILPTIGDTIGKFKDRLVAVRPSAGSYVEHGNYATVITGLRGQFGLATSRLASEVVAARLGMASGDALSELAASNYDCPRLEGATKAIGEVVLTRTVVHAVKSPTTITAADATDEDSLVALLTDIAAVMNAHLLSVFNATTGLGAHETDDTSTEYGVVGSLSTFGDMVDTANDFKEKTNFHFASLNILSGDDIGIHKDADTENVVTTTDATASNPGDPYDDATATEKQRVLILANAIKRSIVAHLALEARAGTIRTGQSFALTGVPSAVPPVLSGQYAATQDVYVRVAAQTATVPIEAARTGPGQNLPLWQDGTGPTLTVVPTTPLFDSAATLKFAPTSIAAAGGWDGQPDDALTASASASWTGVYGPTKTALVAGSLRSAGTNRAVYKLDAEKGFAVVYATDPSWAQSNKWLASIEQTLKGTGGDDEWLGLGCRLRMGRVLNRVIRAEITIVLRDAKYLADTSQLATLLHILLKAYFDQRSDYWIFRLSTLRGICSKVDRKRVQTCSSVIIRDSDGAPIAEPSEPASDDPLVHWYLGDNAVEVTFSAPN